MVPPTTSVATPFRGLHPQEWYEVTAPPADIANETAALLPDVERMFTLDELAETAATIAAREDLWRPMVVVDAERRRYRLMYEDERVDIWTLSWMPGQGTGFHDHDLSGVALACAQGMVVEKQMVLPSGATRVEMRPGDVRTGGAGYIHSVGWGEGEPAVTIHCYSSPLLRVGQYRVDDNGILRRHVEHGRQELMDYSIAAVDPSRADG